ncbi:autotransporter outer membrane beta-barrel domain-containing protein [Xanthomonas sp. 60]
MRAFPTVPRLLAVAVHGSLFATMCTPAFAAQVVADGTTITLPPGTYTNDSGFGPDASVLRALRGGTLTTDMGTAVNAFNYGVNAAWAEGAGSRITLGAGVLDVRGDYSAGLVASDGGTIEADRVVIDKRGFGQGISVEGAGSQARLSTGVITTHADDSDGVLAMSGGTAEVVDSRITTHGRGSNGVNANRGDPSVRLDNVEVVTTGDVATGVWSLSDGDVRIQGGALSTSGNRSPGADFRGGTAALEGTRISTGGLGSHALVAQREAGTPAQVAGAGLQIETRGTAAAGVVVRSGAQADLVDGSITTQGAQAHAMLLSGQDSRLHIGASSVQAQGEGARALQAAGGSFVMEGGTLQSAGDALIGVTGPVQLSFQQGAQLGDGSVPLLGLEAGASGAVDLVLAGQTRAHGDIIRFGDNAQGIAQGLNVTLQSGAQWQGSTSVVDRLRLGDRALWTLHGDARVGELALQGGTIAFAQRDGSAFSTLTVDGDYHADDGLVLLNTRLEGDGAPSDRLHVRGNTSGTTRLAVNSVGDSARTVSDGIEVVTVDGRSDGVFSLQGRAVAGTQEYFLHKGPLQSADDGNWYLRSALPDGPDPETPDPGTGPDPETPDPGAGPDPVTPDPDPGVGPGPDPDPGPGLVPVLRPEPGVYWANQNSVMAMFQHRLQDRMGGRLPYPGFERKGAWGRVSQQQDYHDRQSGQLDIATHRSVLQTGTELYGTDSGRVGVMFGHGTSRTRSRSLTSGYTASGEVEGAAAGLYGTWFDPAEDQSGFQLDTWLQWAEFRQQVRGTGLAVERMRSRSASASVEIGYAVPFQIGDYRTLYVEPQLQLTYADYHAKRHVEQNGTVVTAHGAGGLTSRVGLRLYGRSGTPDAHLQQHYWVQPYLTFGFINNSQSRDALRFDGTPWPGSSGAKQLEGKLGVQLQLGARTMGWGEFGLQNGDGRYHGVGGQIGLRHNW